MNKILVATLICSIMLTGCSLTTPSGTITLTYDKDIISESTVLNYKDSTLVLHTEKLKTYVDDFLNSMSLPEGMSSDSVKKFVYSNLESLGISIDNISDEDILNVEESIKSSLEQLGIDTSELNLNLEEALNE